MKERPFIEWIGKNSKLSEADLERSLQVKSNCAGCFHMMLRVDKTQKRVFAVPHCRVAIKSRLFLSFSLKDSPPTKALCADALSLDQDENCTNKMSTSLFPKESLCLTLSPAVNSSGVTLEDFNGFHERALAEIEPLRASEALMKSY